MASCVCGIHVYYMYQEIWIPTTGEMLGCKGEDRNTMDSYAIAITKGQK